MSDRGNVTLELSRDDYAFLLCALRICRDYMIREGEQVDGFDGLIERIREQQKGQVQEAHILRSRERVSDEIGSLPSIGRGHGGE